jgi:two-component system sensor histidine kinase UhpB
VTWSVLAIMAPILLLWASVRFGVIAVSLALLAVTVIATLSTVRGLGPFTDLSPVANTLSLQLFILSGGLSFVTLAIVLAERRENSSALESARERLSRLNRDLIAARELEAGRISRELHDDVGQRIALVSIGLSRLRSEEEVPKQVEHITHLQGQLSTVVRSIREVSHRLHPTSLEHVGLSNAIEEQCEEVRRATGLQVYLIADADSRAIPPDISRCLFRVAQEAINNVLRHAQAHSIHLALTRTNGTINLVVSDDGRGLPGGRATTSGGIGLMSMAERVGALGGVLSVAGPQGMGTTVRVTLPVLEHDHA